VIIASTAMAEEDITAELAASPTTDTQAAGKRLAAVAEPE
jgi:hypothetical protein